MPSSRALAVSLALPALGFAAALGACAAEPPVPAASSTRLLVKLAEPSSDGTHIAAQASAATGRTVRYLSSTSEWWHAVVVPCSGDADCQAMLAALQASPRYAAVQRDERKRIVTP
jgi:hypothetical protein